MNRAEARALVMGIDSPMWCEHCRQNVAGMVSPTQDSVCCPRCRCALPGVLTKDSPPLPSPAPPRPPALDAWDIDEDLRHMERLLRRDASKTALPVLHLEPALATRERGALDHPPGPPASSSVRGLLSGVSWLLLCTGLAATVCGLMLLAWHWFAERPELLIPGLACAAAGQFCLLGGFLVQPAGGPAAPPPALTDPAHSAEQWLDVHRRIDEILRADLPESHK